MRTKLKPLAVCLAITLCASLVGCGSREQEYLEKLEFESRENARLELELEDLRSKIEDVEGEIASAKLAVDEAQDEMERGRFRDAYDSLDAATNYLTSAELTLQ